MVFKAAAQAVHLDLDQQQWFIEVSRKAQAGASVPSVLHMTDGPDCRAAATSHLQQPLSQSFAKLCTKTWCACGMLTHHHQEVIMVLAMPSLFTALLRAGLHACMPNGGSKSRLIHSSNQIKCFSSLAASLRASLVYLPNTHGCCSLSLIEIDLLGVPFLDTVGTDTLSRCAAATASPGSAASSEQYWALQEEMRAEYLADLEEYAGLLRLNERAPQSSDKMAKMANIIARLSVRYPSVSLHVFTGVFLHPRCSHIWQSAMTYCLSSAHQHPAPQPSKKMMANIIARVSARSPDMVSSHGSLVEACCSGLGLVPSQHYSSLLVLPGHVYLTCCSP